MKTYILFFGFLVAYTATYSQWVQTAATINGEAAGDLSGYSVSLSTDGNRLAVGAYSNDGNGGDSGHVRVFEWQAGNWAQLGADINGEAFGDYSGVSVSISGNGSRVAIGASGNDGNGAGSGHVRIYEWQGASWVQVGGDIDGEAAGDAAGVSVSLSSDGMRVAVGAYLNDGNGADSGHVRIYQWQGGAWVQLGADINGEAANDWFGYSVTLNADGSRVAGGGIGNDGNGSNSGHTRVYEWQGGAWAQLGIDINGEAADDGAGVSVSFSSSGNRLAIGASGNDGVSSNSGHARVYQWQGTAWTQLGLDINGVNTNDGAGRSVSLSGDGSRIAVGADLNNPTPALADAGHARVYEWQGASWVLLGTDIYGVAASDGFGRSVSLNSDGSRLVAGAYQNDGNGANSGHVRTFRFASPNTLLGIGSGVNTSGEGNVFFGYHSGFNNTTGSANTYLGESAGYTNTSGSGNLFLGNRAGYSETGSNLLYIDNSDTTSPLLWGDFATNALRINGTLRITNISQDDGLSRILVADANGNVAWRSDSTLGGVGGTFPSYPQSAGDGGSNTNSYFGHQAGLVNTGADNTFIGNRSGMNTTTGYENSSLGSRTLENNTTGARNTANGVYTLFANTTGNENTAVGYAALGFNTSGSRNTAGGYNSMLVNTTGTENTATGYQALTNNQSGSYNTGMGGYVMTATTIGSNNTALGHRALQYNESGSQNVAIGVNAGPVAGAINLLNTTALGYGASVTASNQIRLGNDQVTSIGGFSNWTNISDGRFKKEIREDVAGLAFIEKLRPVSYVLDKPKLRGFLNGEKESSTEEDTERVVGFVAQEVEDIIAANGYVFSGVDKPKNEQDHYGLRYAEFVVPLVKAVQEQQQLIEVLQRQNATQQEEIEALKNIVYGASLKTSDITSKTPGESQNLLNGFRLYQNTPNPFDQRTVISAELPENVKQAKIVIYNLQGLELTSYSLNGNGRVSVEISGGRFPSGMYLYALVVGGQVIDTKKMVLTK